MQACKHDETFHVQLTTQKQVWTVSNAAAAANSAADEIVR